MRLPATTRDTYRKNTGKMSSVSSENKKNGMMKIKKMIFLEFKE